MNRLETGEWDRTYNPVHLVQRSDGRLYVCADSNHRVRQHTYSKYELTYAEVDVYAEP